VQKKNKRGTRGNPRWKHWIRELKSRLHNKKIQRMCRGGGNLPDSMSGYKDNGRKGGVGGEHQCLSRNKLPRGGIYQ